MQRISKHIEKLLLFNDCVIIPDLGGFVLQHHPAVYVSSDHYFLPPYKEIVFNPSLNHNDGLLIETYMQEYGMDFTEAKSTLKFDVESLKKELYNIGNVSLGTVGMLYAEKNCFLYKPAESISDFNVSSYGLEGFYLPPIAYKYKSDYTYKPEVCSVDKQVYSKPKIYLSSLHNIAIRVAVMIILAIGLFLIFSTPVNDVNGSAYTASFIPSEMIQKIPELHESEGDNMKNFIAENDNNSNSNLSDNISLNKEQKISSQSELPEYKITEKIKNESGFVYPKIETVSKKTYYVIIASFGTEAPMKKFLMNNDLSSLKNMGVVKNSERIRVYADKTDNRIDAEAYVDLLRKNEKYKDAWLFIGR